MSLAGHFSKLVLRNGLLAKSNFHPVGGLIARHSSIWEPDYLILAKTKTPEYDLLNIQIKGYDFVILEKYQQVINRIAKYLKVNIVKSWPAPQQDLVVHHYKPNSADIEYKYSLRVSERNIQIVDAKSNIMALFIEAIVTTCPPGVNISIHEHEEEMETSRYVPNFGIVELEKELEAVGSDKKQSKKKKF